jgi:uncharacterized protein YajQ (UPF0234 family)
MELIDINDFQEFLSHQGAISGISDKTHIDKIETELFETCKQENIQNANKAMVIFEIHSNTSLMELSNAVENAGDYLCDDVLFDFSFDDTIALNEVSYRLLYTADKEVKFSREIVALRSIGIDTRLHKQLYDENHNLRLELENLKRKNALLQEHNRRLEDSIFALHRYKKR